MKLRMVVCENRHKIPGKTDGAIFPEQVENIFDFSKLYQTADKKIPQSCGYLELYITGLTPCVLTIAAVCHNRGIAFDCLHYNREDGKYMYKASGKTDKT